MIFIIVEACGRACNLRQSRVVVLERMARYAHKDGTGIFPGNVVLAQEAHCSVRTVVRCINDLLAARFLERDPRRPNNLRAYCIPLEKIGLTPQKVEASLKSKYKQQPEPPPSYGNDAIAQETAQPSYVPAEKTVNQRIKIAQARLAEWQEKADRYRITGKSTETAESYARHYEKQLEELLAEKARKEPQT